MDETRIVSSRTGSVFSVALHDDGVLVYRPARGSTFSYAAALEALELGIELSGGQPRPTLVLMLDVARVDREARSLFASDAFLPVSRRSALVVGSPVSRVIGNFFLGLNRVSVPCKVFDDQERARRWLFSSSSDESTGARSK